MAEQSKLDVSRWQAARPRWVYTPVLWFYYRMIEVAYLDARPKENGAPTDEALLARDWIARSPSAPAGTHEFVSFPECCQMLGLDPERERLALLDAIDKAVDSDNDEAWARLEELAAREPLDDAAPLFDAPRVVPALDQLSLLPPEAA
jgi:hypothetical protein